MAMDRDNAMAAELTDEMENRLVALAWAGWHLQMPGQWQPLKLSGTPQKGNILVGDSVCAIFSVHWERPAGMAVSEGDAWVAGRLKKLGIAGEPNPPAREHFTACGWTHGLETEEEKATTYWYGYAAQSGLVLGIKVNGFLGEAIRSRVVKEVLPTVRTTSAEHETAWSMYDVSFQSPPHFTLSQRHLFSGDVAMEFVKGSADALLLRQVYPGDLALTRRPFDRWLEMRPFKEHRRLRRRSMRTEPWRHGNRANLTGIVRHGRKQLGIPMGWCSPRWTCGLAVHDTGLNRLLIVEHLSARGADLRICERAIEGMNQNCAR